MRQARKQATGTGNKTQAQKTQKAQGGHSSRKITPADVASVGEPLFYTIRQAAATLGCSYRTIEQLVRDGRLFSVKHGGRRLIPAWAAAAYARDLCASQDYDGRYAAYTAEYGLSA